MRLVAPEEVKGRGPSSGVVPPFNKYHGKKKLRQTSHELPYPCRGKTRVNVSSVIAKITEERTSEFWT
jgi:hypothetical protein